MAYKFSFPLRGKGRIGKSKKSAGGVYFVRSTVCFVRLSADLVCSPARQDDVPFCMFPVQSYIYSTVVGRPCAIPYVPSASRRCIIFAIQFESKKKSRWEAAFCCTIVISFKN